MKTHSVTVRDLLEKKKRGEKITMLTAYDAPTAQLIDEAGIDAVLVGDSLGMVALGYASTVPVTMEEMLHHARAVRRGTRRALLVGDMPFLSFQVSPEEAVRNAGRFVKEAQVDAVKLEGGSDSLPAVRAILKAGIAVLGHVGLTPQSAVQLGGYRVQGKTAAEARRIFEDAKGLEAAGCFGVVLECVPDRLAREITAHLKIPTIGIGAGGDCDGQVLVTSDLLGLTSTFKPKFVKTYGALAQEMKSAFELFRQDVSAGQFPKAEHTFSISDEELKQLLEGPRLSPD